VGGAWRKEESDGGVNMVEVYYILRKSNTDTMNLIKEHYIHVCKYHNECLFNN
jgi:hypothetical protein